MLLPISTAKPPSILAIVMMLRHEAIGSKYYYLFSSDFTRESQQPFTFFFFQMFNNINQYHCIYRFFRKVFNNTSPANINNNILPIFVFAHNILQACNIFCIWLAAYLNLRMNIGLWNDTAPYIQQDTRWFHVLHRYGMQIFFI
ncbi:MAG: hypothetical protein C0466_00820 [Candidatus Accumulibacter sp.]|nr:hypothetical protein [Accumulibacter sp.]